MVTISGTTFSLESDGSTLVMDGTTKASSSLLSTEVLGGAETEVNIGSIIGSLGRFAMPTPSLGYLQVGETAKKGTVLNDRRRKEPRIWIPGVMPCGNILGMM